MNKLRVIENMRLTSVGTRLFQPYPNNDDAGVGSPIVGCPVVIIQRCLDFDVSLCVRDGQQGG